ncbi:glutamate-rich protein 5 [Anolis sagrei]|uniref:glutamate-rich protein 5 n=1 Tax=Anolis sagrei TaxID=38937 RepID=UPI003520A1C5
MGCSSSVQTHVKEKSRLSSKTPDLDGMQKGDANLPIANEKDTIPDQTKLGAIDEVELGSPGIKQSESLDKEVADILIPGLTNCALSTCQRVDPEGTEPQPLALEEKLNISGPFPASLLEAGEPRSVDLAKEEVSEPPTVHEAANILSPEAGEPRSVELAEDVVSQPPTVHEAANILPPEAGEPQSVELAEEDINEPPTVHEAANILPPEAGEPRSVELVEEEVSELPTVHEAANILPPEIVENNTPKPVESSQEDPPEPVAEEIVNLVTEMVKELEAGDVELLTKGEAGEKMETEKHCEIVSECSETKEEEMGEATASAATEIEVTNEE